MANRYWRGGSGNWDTSSTANWSATSGGSGGASVPTAADSVFFDQAGTYTVTLSLAITCLDITVSAGTVTFGTGTTPALAISGSMSFIAGTVWTGGNITFNATTTGKTITTNGTVFGGITITFSGVGGGWTLGSSFTGTQSTNLTINNGTFNSGNFSITVGNIVSNGAATRTISLGSSTITLQGGTTPINLAATGLTFNAGTSQINLTGTSGASIAGAGQTFYNVAYTASPTTTGVVRAITGANTFNNLTLVPRTTADVVAYAFTADQTINGTLTISPSTNATMRVALVPASNWGYASALGVTRTLTCNAVSTLTDVDFMDIAFAGNCVSGGNLTGTRLGNMKGNSGITFTAAATKYWNLAAGGSWSATAWATSSGGTPAITNFPLAQDTCVFEATGLNSGATVTVNAGYALGTIDMSARTSNTMTFNAGTGAPFIFGNFVSGTGVTLTGTNGIVFSGRASQTITSSGVSFGFPINVNSPGGTVTQQDATTVTTGTCFHINGTFDLNNLTWTANIFSQGGANGSPVIAFGTGNITLIGSGTVWTGSTAAVTGTPNVYVSNNSATATTIQPNAPTEANSINFIITVGTYSLAISSAGGGVVRNLDFSNGGTSTYTGTWAGTVSTLNCYGNLTLKSGMTVTGTGTITFSATSGTKTITSAGLTNTHPMTFNGVGGTWQLQDALNISSATTGAITLTNGTFDLNGFTATLSAAATASFTTGVGTKNLTFNGGTLAIAASGATAFNNAQPTGFTTTAGTGTGTISFTSASAKTIVGGSSTYNCVLNQGGAGALTITGSNIFSDITNTYSATGATSILLSSGQTVAAFTASGAATKLLTLNSSTSGVQTTLALSSGGTVSTDYLSVKDIAFTPAPATDGTTPYVWYLGANSTNSGNNTGGLFQGGGAGALKVYRITNTATTSWTVPSDWNSSSNTIHLIGAGGGGGTSAVSGNNRAAGGGGGGGGYTAVSNYLASPSASVTVAIGTSASNADGTNTTWASGTYTAGGGKKGTAATTPTSAGGAGGTGTYAGGAGGAGAFGTVAATGYGAGGGGGASGPNGIGGAGGTGFGSTTTANIAGGGGGGNGGGSAGGNASSATGGTGGNNFGGTGGGASNTAGTIGGGGGGGVGSIGRAGGTGIDILNTIGGAGGTGGGASLSSGTAGNIYGGGGSGGTVTTSGAQGTSGAGGQGLIVIAYVPSAAPVGNSNFFMLWN